MSKPATTYVYHRGQRGIFAEIYFPRRIAAQGTIFTALEGGYKEEVVKTYLKDNIDELLEELRDYWQIFDPNQYTNKRKKSVQLSPKEAFDRIDMYKSPFSGWSNYAVDGVFFNSRGEPIEESTQVIRIMFRLNSSYELQAENTKCQDVLRAMLFWTITRQALIHERTPWDRTSRARFLRQYPPWTKYKKDFVEQYFEPVAKEATKWMDDCRLFVFGYLVRQFSERLLAVGRPEEEIWVASFFNLTISIMKQTGK